MSDRDFALLPRVINGAIAASVGSVIIFPLDLAKTRLQNQTIGPNGERQYSSLIDCFVKTARNEGFFGLYRGLGVNFSFVGFEKGLKLAANDYFRYWLSSESSQLNIKQQVIAGGLAGLVQMMVSCPTELLKIQLQDAGRVSAGKKISATMVAKKLITEKGITGIYKGLFPTGLRDVSFAIIYFPTYAYIHDLGPQEPDGRPKWYWHLVCGLISAGISAWASTPFDVLKTRLQTLEVGKGQRKYTGIWDCFQSTLKEGGTTSFFKGGLCRIVVIGPLYSIAQCVYYVGVAEWALGYSRQNLVK